MSVTQVHPASGQEFGTWHDHMISEDHTDWEKCDTMNCNHGDPCKELRYPDLAEPPLDYLKHCGVFKAKKTNEYDLCRFYRVELSGDLPTFPKGLGSRASQPSCSLCVGLGHSCLSFTRATQQGHPQALAHGAETRCSQEGYKETVILPTLSVQWQQRPVVHESHCVQAL